MPEIPILLMVRELGWGGSERQLTEMARSLDRSRFRVHVACFRAEGMRVRELEKAGVPILALPVRSLRGISAVTGANMLLRYLRKHSIQLVHTFDSPTNLFGVPVARMAGTRVVLSSQRAYRELTPPVQRRLLRGTDRMVDGVVVNCQALARHMIEDEGWDGSRVSLCYNGVDTGVFHPGVRGNGLTIGTMCALRPEKRLDLLLAAFARIAQPGRKLVVVGSGPVLGELKEQCAGLSIEQYCHFEPATTAVADWLRTMDIFVLPSRTEALSNSLMEAMACGCAAVASDVGGNPELISDGSTGLLFPNGDVGALAAALDRLAGDASLRAELGDRAAACIEEQFTLGVAARRMGEIYLEKLES